MGTVQEATLTLGEAARRLDTTVDAVLELVYDGTLPAVAEHATGRLLVNADDIDRLRRQGG